MCEAPRGVKCAYNVRVPGPKSLAFNLEPTFRCNLWCEMCPRFSSVDPQLDMSLETYSRIREAFHLAHTVDFTGWGEPMFHPRIYEMIHTASDRDCVTTMTSNGTILNARNAGKLIEAGMNRLTVSIDGLRAETFEAVRPGASFDQVTANLKELASQVEKSGSDLRLGVAFTIQEANAAELGLLIPWLTHVGARVLHLKHLNVVSTKEDWSRSFLKYRLSPAHGNGDVLTKLETVIVQVTEEANNAGIEVLMHSEFPMDSKMTPRHCLAAPLKAVYFSHEGRVAPCCFFGHHVANYFDGVQYPPSALFYGDIREHDFLEIWESGDFQTFRRGFETGEYPEECETCYLLYGK